MKSIFTFVVGVVFWGATSYATSPLAPPPEAGLQDTGVIYYNAGQGVQPFQGVYFEGRAASRVLFRMQNACGGIQLLIQFYNQFGQQIIGTNTRNFSQGLYNYFEFNVAGATGVNLGMNSNIFYPSYYNCGARVFVGSSYGPAPLPPLPPLPAGNQ